MTAANILLDTAPPTPTGVERLAIVVRDSAFDALLAPLTFAWEMSRHGAEVDILFVLWAVRLLSRQGVRETRISLHHAEQEQWLRARLRRDGDPLEIHDFLRHLHSTGRVRFHACRMAARTFDVTELIDEAAGFIDPGTFLRTIALPASHTQYF